MVVVHKVTWNVRTVPVTPSTPHLAPCKTTLPAHLWCCPFVSRSYPFEDGRLFGFSAAQLAQVVRVQNGHEI